MKFSMKSKCRHLLSVMLIVLCISCEDDKSKIDTPSQPYDPSKPVLVSDFLPKKEEHTRRWSFMVKTLVMIPLS